MPREIDCPKCDGCGDNLFQTDICNKCEGSGKIKVYTQEELDNAIGEYANTKLYQEGYKSGVKAEYELSKKNIIQAVKDEREEIIKMIDYYLFGKDNYTYKDLFKAIRKRGEG